jgi:hypothetical protein
MLLCLQQIMEFNTIWKGFEIWVLTCIVMWFWTCVLFSRDKWWSSVVLLVTNEPEERYGWLKVIFAICFLYTTAGLLNQFKLLRCLHFLRMTQMLSQSHRRTSRGSNQRSFWMTQSLTSISSEKTKVSSAVFACNVCKNPHWWVVGLEGVHLADACHCGPLKTLEYHAHLTTVCLLIATVSGVFKLAIRSLLQLEWRYYWLFWLVVSLECYPMSQTSFSVASGYATETQDTDYGINCLP